MQCQGCISACSDRAVFLHAVSGLYFWRTVLSTGGYTGCFVLGCPNKEVSDSPLDVPTLKKLAFLIQNCLVKVSTVNLLV